MHSDHLQLQLGTIAHLAIHRQYWLVLHHSQCVTDDPGQHSTVMALPLFENQTLGKKETTYRVSPPTQAY